jgi:hypothetical protein
MGRWRFPAAVAIGAALLAACADTTVVAADDGTTSTSAAADQTTAGPGRITTTTLPDQSRSITFTLGINDDGARLRIRPGDEVVPRLPLAGLEDPGWILVVAPNPAVLAGGDDLLWRPSEIEHGGVAFHEFNFIAAGPGETTVTLIHGWQEFTFTVLVATYE